VIGVYKSESLKPVIDADHMPFHQIIRKLGLGLIRMATCGWASSQWRTCLMGVV